MSPNTDVFWIILHILTLQTAFSIIFTAEKYRFKPLSTKIESRLSNSSFNLHKHVKRLSDVNKLELVFLIDASTSVGTENFRKEISFVRKLLADFIVSPNSTHVSIITFSSRSHVQLWTLDSNDVQKCSLYKDIMPNIKYRGGATYTYGALLKAQVNDIHLLNR